MKTSTKIAVAFAALTGIALTGIAGATVAAQAGSLWHGRDGGPAHGTQQAHGMHHGMHGGMHGGGHHGMRFHGERHGGMKHGGGRHMARMLDNFDANGDGKLSQAEIDQTRGERLSSFDADKDQSLTLGEYEQLWLDAMRERMVDRFQDLDADGDAKVTAEEFQRPFAKVVRHMDRNEDGVVDRGDFERRRRPAPESGDDNG
ncbi:MAG TPA: hypothetical protein VIR45_12480 [Kiloniellaceae bacterium]